MTNDPKSAREGPALRPLSKVVETGDIRTFSSEHLFSGHREILIAHEDKTYRLRITNQNKLILTL